MRKYQQLLLIIISVLSITVLLMYKSENKRLKYVLQVVNFFGRSDAAVLARLENNTNLSKFQYDFTNPVPVWQRIGGGFHSYSSFWSKNILVAGGEIYSIVVGKRSSIVNFKCEIRYEEDKVIAGKFGFVQVDRSDLDNDVNLIDDAVVYKFICRTSRDFGQPQALILTETKSKTKHELKLRYVHNKNPSTKQLLTACVNLVPYNETHYSKEYMTRKNILQFFIHHQIIGVEDFLIYNADVIDAKTRQFLLNAGLRLHFIPYNFPFDYKTNKTRTIIEMDCLMRNVNAAEYTILVEPNQFFFPNIDIHVPGSVIRSLKHHDQETTKFEIPMFFVCIDHRRKLLMDNTYYNPDVHSRHSFFIYKPTFDNESTKSMKLYVTRAFSHNYINCDNIKNSLHDWRSSIREDFMQYIATLRNQIEYLI